MQFEGTLTDEKSYGHQPYFTSTLKVKSRRYY